jgi:cytochrome c553
MATSMRNGGRSRSSERVALVLALAVAVPAMAQDDAFRELIISIGDAELGEYLSGECVTCHKPDAEPTGGVPEITGLPVEQFATLLLSYRNKERENPVMQTIAGRLSDEEIASLAAYFATRETE